MAEAEGAEEKAVAKCPPVYGADDSKPAAVAKAKKKLVPDPEFDGVFLVFATRSSAAWNQRSFFQTFMGQWFGNLWHLELVFKVAHETESRYVGCSVVQGGPVYMERRVYNRGDGFWMFRGLPATQEQVASLWSFCRAQRGKDDARHRLMSALYGWPFTKTTPEPPEDWFSSELVLAALQQSGILETIDTDGATCAEIKKLRAAATWNPGCATPYLIFKLLEPVTLQVERFVTRVKTLNGKKTTKPRRTVAIKLVPVGRQNNSNDSCRRSGSGSSTDEEW